MLIYMAVAIDRANMLKDKFDEIVYKILEHGDDAGVMLFMPSRAFAIAGPISDEDCRRLVAINWHALSLAHALIVYYIPGVESWGLSAEIIFARDHEIPIYLVSDQSLRPGGKYEDFPVYLRQLVRADHCIDLQDISQLVYEMTHP